MALQGIPRGQSTTDSFTYEVSDGHGGTATATVTITVTGVIDHPPVANPDGYAVDNNAVLNGSAAGGVLANDTDPDGDALVVDQLNGAGGTAPLTGTSVEGATVTITTPTARSRMTPRAPPPCRRLRRAEHEDSFTYGVSDGHGGTATATVTIRSRGWSIIRRSPSRTPTRPITTRC